MFIILILNGPLSEISYRNILTAKNKGIRFDFTKFKFDGFILLKKICFVDFFFNL